MNQDIHKLATLITEDVNELMDLGDIDDDDQFSIATPSGYGCGRGCWQYEELQLNVDGQVHLATATIEYDDETELHKGYPPTRYDPGEPSYLEPAIGRWAVKEFEIFDNQGNPLLSWNKRLSDKWVVGKRPSDRATTRVLRPEPANAEVLKSILDQIGQQFEADGEQVMEYMQEHYEEPEPDYY